jgi:hypothetical protein
VSAPALRPRRVGEILDAAIKIYLANARTLMGLAAAVVIPVQVVIAIVYLSTFSAGSDVPGGSFAISLHPQPAQDPAARAGASVVVSLLSLVVAAFVTAASVKAVSDAYLGHPPAIGTSLRYALRRLLAVLGCELLRVLGLIVAFVALIVPGVWLYGRWSVALPALLVERTGPVSALRRSSRLVKGRWWPSAGVLIVSSVMAAIVGGALSALLIGLASLPSQPSLGLAVLVTTLSGVVTGVITQPFTATVTTILYYDLRVRREAYDLQVLADQLGLPPAAVGGSEWPDGAGDGGAGSRAGDGWTGREHLPLGPESVGRPGGPPFWPPPPGWRPPE